MPFTALEKREARAAKAIASGRRPRPQKHPCIRMAPPPACEPAPKKPAVENQLTMEEELNRSRMECEDLRARAVDVVRASASLVSFFAVWLQPGQMVTLRPHYEHVLLMGPSEKGVRYRLHKQNAAGLWQLEVAMVSQTRKKPEKAFRGHVMALRALPGPQKH